jgi:hypothetical protein
MAITAAVVALVVLAAASMAARGWAVRGRRAEAPVSFFVPGEPVQPPAILSEGEEEREGEAA